MPVISMFYGVIVLMYYFDNRQHKLPHIHVRYGEEEVVLSIPDGEVLEGSLRTAKNEACTSVDRDSSRRFDGQLGLSGERPISF